MFEILIVFYTTDATSRRAQYCSATCSDDYLNSHAEHTKEDENYSPDQKFQIRLYRVDSAFTLLSRERLLKKTTKSLNP